MYPKGRVKDNFLNIREVVKMENLFSIGEVSKRKGITIKALRYYHKMGILIPRYIDDKTGYRYYSIEQFIYIDIIKGCRALGTSILELQEIFKERDTKKLLKFLELKRNEAQENINKMKEIIKSIDKLNMSVEYSNKVLNNDDISIKDFEERYIIVAPCKESGNLKELIYYSNLEKVIEDENLDITMDKGIMYNINSEGKIKSMYVFNGIQFDDKVKIKNNIKILPKGKYLTLSYSKENEEDRIAKLLEYARINNLQIKSFIEIELFNDFFNIDSYSCEIQMLIEGKINEDLKVDD